jgi:acyl carrier protein
MLSNKVVAVVAVALFAFILLDGRAYNRNPDRVGIHTLPATPDIKIKKDDELILAFSHLGNRWHLTEPFIAPVRQSRVEALLATNIVTARNYDVDEINSDDLFRDSVSVEFGEHVYRIGQLEPVSQLRYVLANNRVYLQADTVIPLLHAGQSAFVDLTMTRKVTGVTINQQELDNADQWSNLKSLGVIAQENIANDPVARIALTSANNQRQDLYLHSVDGVAVLSFSGEKYGFLLSDEQARTLNLIDYL